MTHKAWTRIAVLALLWGSAFLWIKVALDHGLSPLQVTVARSAFGALALVVLARMTGRRLPRDRATWGRLVVAAFFCNALPFLLFAVGVESTSSGMAGALNATTPLWSLLVGMAIGTERGLRPVRLAGLLLGFAGTLLIFAPWQGSGPLTWGVLAMLGGAASYAVAFAYMGRELVGRGAPVALSAAQLLMAAGLSAPVLAVSGAVPAEADVTALVAVVILGVFCTGVTFYLNFRLIEDEGATSAAVVGYLLPVVSVALGALVLDEELTLRVIAGMAVVLLGVGLTRRTPPHPIHLAGSRGGTGSTAD
ncbi:DMT family transporter [Nonomuraea jiangxiensis]|uniref:Permease of the drug/metabolite transporter (DMT) superfamily n=1 Tax=Nonomuraea jiangxiensis TaxID=633440 RepID=A0A1G8P5H1_9ACTN|nr:DMT family transporter [Nonomuraea jiangxiensis]SDI87556.1 Permease of the drug/metabolite transporter (DMT) superfamily [Nonomuraea jiangxiensis]